MANKKREKILAAITVVIIAGAILNWALVKPQTNSLRQLRLDRQLLEQKLLKLKSDYRVKDQINEIYTQIEPLMQSKGTDQQEISQFTRQLNDLYGPLGLTIKSVKILPPTHEPFYRSLSIKIEMSGKIKRIASFMELLTSQPEPIKIESFTLQAQEVADSVSAMFLITKILALEE